MKSVSVHCDFFRQIRKHSDEEIGRFFRALASDIDGSECPELPATLDMLREMVVEQNERFSRQQVEKRKPKGPTRPNAPNPPNAPTRPSVPVTVSDSVSVTDSDTMENQNTCAQEPRTSVAEHDIPQAENSPATGDGAREQQHGGNGSEYTAEFETFWEAYPRRVRKPDAFKAWRTRKKSGLPVSEIVLATQTYAKAMAYLDRPPDKIMHPQTFINAERWRGWLPPDGQEYLDARQSAMAMNRSGGIRHGPDAYEQAKATTPTEILGSIFGTGVGLARGDVVDVGRESDIDAK